jgi:CheY-like chemotaxis protein
MLDITREHDQTHKVLIMLVDDNSEFLSAIQLTLEMEGFEVQTALDGEQALNKLKDILRGQGQTDIAFKRLPDLILADIMMPVMDGYAFYEQVRANPYLNHIPFIFLTAKSDDIDIRHGKELGVEDYLSKLTLPEDLLATIRGKLKRIEQRRAVLAQFDEEPNRPLRGIVITLVVVGALIILAFYLGILLS